MARRSHVLGVVAVALFAGVALAQSPPPRVLPPGITGAATPAPTGVRPAADSVAQAAPPANRFLSNMRAFPDETQAAVFSARSAAEWLSRMNQQGGRFVPGVNAAWKRYLDGDSDLRQVTAALGLCEAAAFTGDDKLAARANGAVLAMLSLTKVEGDGCRVPVAGSDRCNRVAFAATLALAITKLPAPNAQQLADADALCGFLRRQVDASGAVRLTDAAGDDAAKLDSEGVAAAPGLAMQAFAAVERVKPNPATREVLGKCANHYRTVIKSGVTMTAAASLLPAFVEVTAMTKNDPAMTGAAFELADFICQCQVIDVRTPQWMGGFRATPGGVGEPTDSAAAVLALAHATRLTRQVPDLARYGKYRAATVAGLAFCQSLQFTHENADHFEKAYRTAYLVGGCRVGPADGSVRADATAQLLRAGVAFLASGAEGKPE